MSARLGLTLVWGAALAALVAGCGGSSNVKGKGRGGSDDAAKKIKRAEKSAARSCVLEHVKQTLLLAEADRDRVREPLTTAEKKVEGFQGEMEELRSSGSNPIRLAEVQKLLAEAQKEVRSLKVKLAPELDPLEAEVAGWIRLRKGLEGSSQFTPCRIKDHTINAFNQKLPNMRTSTMVLIPSSYQFVLGKDPLKFTLYWRRMARKIPYTTKFKVNYELSQVKLTAGGKRVKQEVVRPTDDPGADEPEGL
jgi:hypothetical protein